MNAKLLPFPARFPNIHSVPADWYVQNAPSNESIATALMFMRRRLPKIADTVARARLSRRIDEMLSELPDASA